MHIVVFEFTLKDNVRDRYFELAAQMREEVEQQPGFISIERFESLNDPAKVVSISSWESDEAIKAWKKNLQHREAQNEGKDSIFASFRLRVAEVIRDYGFDNT